MRTPLLIFYDRALTLLAFLKLYHLLKKLYLFSTANESGPFSRKNRETNYSFVKWYQ
jgi:hypothetical protein